MTKEELQARLQELNERQAQENRRNMETIGSLIEAFEHGQQDLADRLRDSKMEETLLHDPSVIMLSKGDDGKCYAAYDCQSEDDLNDLRFCEIE